MVSQIFATPLCLVEVKKKKHNFLAINNSPGESRAIINNRSFVFVHFCFFEDLMLTSSNVVVTAIATAVVVPPAEVCLADSLRTPIAKPNLGNQIPTLANV